MAQERYLVLARKWRPQRFEDVVGQEHITRTLRNAITTGRIHHAFLFIGSRGIGKTTTARILAKALNCLATEGPTPEPCGVCANCTAISAGNHIDIIEIDGASNNGVDDVREIRENVRMVPVNGRYKVYIIDEVHQLSLPAFNALLKTLEEPPPHALFILATTEAHKVPATIISRCQRYDFRRVAIADLMTLLRGILDSEGIAATDEALHAIARAAEGGIRDAESILDELITYCGGEITFSDVNDVLGLVNWNQLHDLCDALHEKDVTRQLLLIEEVAAAGKDLGQFVQDILRYFRNLLVSKSTSALELLHLPEDEVAALQARAARYTLTQLIRIVEQFAELNKDFDSQLAQRIALESLLIRLSRVGTDVSVETILDKLLTLSEGPAPPQPPPASPPGRPTEAGPAPAPTEPAPTRRPEVTRDNLLRFWSHFQELVSKSSLRLGIWLGQGEPIGVTDGILTLRFPSSGTQAIEALSEAENRRILEETLRAATANLLRIETELTAAPTRAERQLPDAPAGTPPPAFYPSVNPEKANAALQDPDLARILDIFKGRIVEIRPPVAPVEDADETAASTADE